MNTFGNIFRVSIFGESHGEAVGVMIDGCPAGIAVDTDGLMNDLVRRRSGTAGTTARIENDLPGIISGVYNGYSTGAPIVILTQNSDRKSSDYDGLRQKPRPGHADMVARMKYRGFSDLRGGGHFSGRLTWGLVVAGSIARKILGDTKVEAMITEAGGTTDTDAAVKMAIAGGDSIGGIIECRVRDIEAGLGEPFFWSAESAISQIIFSIPAIKGIEFGAGFSAASMKGSEHNDSFIDAEGTTLTNNAGGINGGITNGNEFFFRVAVKPTSSISKAQQSIDLGSKRVEELVIEGRHDVCIALRVPVIVESAAAIALADLMLLNRALQE